MAVIGDFRPLRAALETQAVGGNSAHTGQHCCSGNGIADEYVPQPIGIARNQVARLADEGNIAPIRCEAAVSGQAIARVPVCIDAY